ncbi:hypothetical protein BR93DRAFT_214445 [Coniochaeta sp. PMI_546]|nr:hypothetical protein BR93DRAFT_214445 [Coniochaeta sp. PMI_546]
MHVATGATGNVFRGYRFDKTSPWLESGRRPSITELVSRRATCHFDRQVHPVHLLLLTAGVIPVICFPPARLRVYCISHPVGQRH